MFSLSVERERERLKDLGKRESEMLTEKRLFRF